MKTENPAEVGKHAFELAGLGTAPFRFVGASENVITYPDGTQKAGGSCDYCGTGIRTECQVRSADGKLFKVGCNCIEKVGDKGLLKAYKTSPEFRAKQRQIKAAKAAIVHQKTMALRAEVAAIVEAKAEQLSAMPHKYGFKDFKTGVPMTKLDEVKWAMDNSGFDRMESLLNSLKSLFT